MHLKEEVTRYNQKDPNSVCKRSDSLEKVIRGGDALEDYQMLESEQSIDWA